MVEAKAAMVDHGVQTDSKAAEEEDRSVNNEEIMDLDHAKEEKRKRELWPRDDGWVECCHECWYPVGECPCRKETNERE